MTLDMQILQSLDQMLPKWVQQVCPIGNACALYLIYWLQHFVMVHEDAVQFFEARETCRGVQRSQST